VHTRHAGSRRSQAGLTLIEILIGLIIMSVISTMLIMGWVSLQRAYTFTSVTNNARATARDALDRMSSEIRTSQPPTAVVTTQFYLPATPTYPYMCGPTSCVFYSAYNNPASAAAGAGLTPTGTTPSSASAIRLTAIYLRTSDRTLIWQRDRNNNGLDANDPTIILAKDCVNGALSKDIFTYNLRNATSGVYSHTNTLTTANVADLRSVKMEIIIDANLSHTPTYVDLATTVRPRNAAALN
jgi:prepilin-type N-terminal cleavage/methylation domain-containing protein